MKWLKWLSFKKHGRPHSGTGTQNVLDSATSNCDAAGPDVMYKETEEKIKVIVVGDGGCGKTCLLTVFAKGAFLENHIPTVFEMDSISMEVGTKKMQLQLWDTAGQEDYDRLRPLFYPDTDVVLMCYSVDLLSTLQNITEKWAPEVRHFCPTAHLILVGNKSDIREDPTQEHLVTSQQGKEVALAIQADCFLECSALKNQGIEEVFLAAVKSVLGKSEDLRRQCCTIY